MNELIYILTDADGKLYDVLRSEVKLDEVIEFEGAPLKVVAGKITNLHYQQRVAQNGKPQRALQFRRACQVHPGVYLYTQKG